MIKSKLKTSTKERSFFYEQYKNSFSFLKESKPYILFILIVFLLLGLIGFAFPYFFEKEIQNFVSETLTKTAGFSAFQMITYIFFNNLKAGFISMIFGIFLCIPSLSIAVSNGYLIGFVARHAINADGFLILWKLFPHGIFELPAILFSTGMGLKIGFSLIKNTKRYFIKNLSSGLKKILLALVCIFFILPLLLALIAYIFSDTTSWLYLSINFFSFGVLFVFGIIMLLTFRESSLKKHFFRNIKESLRVFIFVIVPLLVIAAIIEGILVFWLR